MRHIQLTNAIAPAFALAALASGCAPDDAAQESRANEDEASRRR
jgi:hypothetical protein